MGKLEKVQNEESLYPLKNKKLQKAKDVFLK